MKKEELKEGINLKQQIDFCDYGLYLSLNHTPKKYSLIRKTTEVLAGFIEFHSSAVTSVEIHDDLKGEFAAHMKEFFVKKKKQLEERLEQL